MKSNDPVSQGAERLRKATVRLAQRARAELGEAPRPVGAE